MRKVTEIRKSMITFGCFASVSRVKKLLDRLFAGISGKVLKN